MTRRKRAKADEPDLEELGFEGAMERLEDLVSRLEEGTLSLDDSIRSFEQGMELVRFCAGELKRAEKRVKELTEEAGRLRLTDFEPEHE